MSLARRYHHRHCHSRHSWPGLSDQERQMVVPVGDGGVAVQGRDVVASPGGDGDDQGRRDSPPVDHRMVGVVRQLRSDAMERVSPQATTRYCHVMESV